MAPGHHRGASGSPELYGGSLQPPDLLPAGGLHWTHQRGMDLPHRAADPQRKAYIMFTLAFGSGFFGGFFGITLLCCASFVAGVIFKGPFLKLITGGKWEG